MPRSILTYGMRIKRRKDFSDSIKKAEWMLAARKNPNDRFIKTSACRECERILRWGDGTYNFDHHDNNSSNKSLRNCYLVCRNCHGKVTKFKKIKIIDKWTGMVTGRKTIKLKAGYKKPRKKTKR